MICRQFVLFIALMLSVFMVSPVAGQAERAGSEGGAIKHDIVNRSLVGKVVRVHTEDQRLIEGRIVRCSSDTLYLIVDYLDSSVMLDNIEALWVRGTKLKRGLITGAIIGGAVGGILGFLAFGIADATCEYECGGNLSTFEGLLAGAGLVAIPGGLIGAGIGAVSHRWNLWYESATHISACFLRHDFAFGLAPLSYRTLNVNLAAQSQGLFDRDQPICYRLESRGQGSSRTNRAAGVRFSIVVGF